MPSTPPVKVNIIGVDKTSKAFATATATAKKMGDSMKTAGAALTRSVTLPVLAGGAAAISFAVDFNKSMANVASLMPGQGKRVEGMKRQIQDLAIASGQSTEKLSAGLYQAISAFGDAEDPVKKLAIAVNAAKAGVATAEEGIGLISSVTKAYGDTTDGALSKVGDLALLTVRLGKTTFPELAASVGKVAAKSKALGVSQEEMFATFATLTGTVGNTAEVSTQFAGVLGGLMKPTDGMAKLVRSLRDEHGKLKYSSASAMVQELGFTKTLEILKNATGGSIDKLGKLFESKEALNTLTALLGANSAEYSAKLGEMSKASGATAAALKEQEEGLNKAGAQWERTKQRFMVFAQRIGDKLIPMFEKVMVAITPLIEKFTSMDDATAAKWGKLIAVLASLGPVLSIGGTVISGVASLVSWISGAGGLTAALALLTGPVGIAVGAFAALAAAAFYFRKELTPVRDVLAEVSGNLLARFKESLGQSATNSGWLGTEMKKMVAVLAPLYAGMAKVTLVVATLPLKWLIYQLGNVIKVVSGVVSWLSSLVATANNVRKIFVSLGELVGTWISQKVDDIPFLSAVRDTLVTIVDYVTKAINLLGELWTTYTSAPRAVIDWISARMNDLEGASASGAASVQASVDEKKKQLLDPTYQKPGIARTSTESKSTVSIDFKNLPNGTAVTTPNFVPGVQLSTNAGPLLSGVQ